MSHKKGANLTLEERVIIQTRLRDKHPLRSIARDIGCAVNTVCNEIRRGRVLLYNGRIESYRAVVGQVVYETNRENCGRKTAALQKGEFLDHVDKMLKEKHWSLDACVGRTIATGSFQRKEILCTKTLYNYVTIGLLGTVKSMDLSLRVRRKNSKKHTHMYKKNLVEA